MFNRDELISVGDIENIHKKRKHDKESRLETVLVSRKLQLTLFYTNLTGRQAQRGVQRADVFIPKINSYPVDET